MPSFVLLKQNTTQLLTDSVESAVGVKVVKNENIVHLYLYYQQGCWWRHLLFGFKNWG